VYRELDLGMNVPVRVMFSFGMSSVILAATSLQYASASHESVHDNDAPSSYTLLHV
jgi:hypothetical protein